MRKSCEEYTKCDSVSELQRSVIVSMSDYYWLGRAVRGAFNAPTRMPD